MKKVTINPSISTQLEIDFVSYNEIKHIYFDNDEDWVGSYDLNIWNSEAKNEEFPDLSSYITVDGTRLTFEISPEAMGLPKNKVYYEIYSEEFDSVIYFGNLTIRK